MKRKIIKQSGQAYTITLPVKWIRANDLEEGGEVDVTEIKKKLIVSGKGDEKETRYINLEIPKEDQNYAKKLIVNSYRAGADKINVYFRGKEEILSDIVNRFLIGFELFEKENNKYLIESISEPGYENFETLVTRLFYTLEDIIEEFHMNKNLERDIYRIQRYDNFLRRSLVKEVYSIEGETFLWELLNHMNEATKNLHIANKLAIKENNQDEKITEVTESLKSMLDILKKSYLKKDINVLQELYHHYKNVNKECETLMPTYKNPMILHHMLSVSRLFYLTANPIIGYFQLESLQEI